MNQLTKILYLGWLGRGNLGDELLFQTFQRMFFEELHRSAGTHEFVIEGLVPLEGVRIDFADYDLVVLGGGSLIHLPYWLDLCAKAQHSGVPVIAWGTGIDGMFAGSLEEFRAGLRFSPQHAARIQEVCSKMELIAVRGEYTRAALASTGIPAESVNVIGDPGLCALKVLKRPRSRVAVNWGTAENFILGGDENAVRAVLADYLNELGSRGLGLTLYPLWVGDIPALQELAAQLRAPDVSVLNEVPAPSELAALLSESIISIAFKLHASVFSASAGCPFLSLAYRGKCFELADSVEMLRYTLSTDHLALEELRRRGDSLLAEASTRSDRLREIRFDYEQKIRATFGPICAAVKG